MTRLYALLAVLIVFGGLCCGCVDKRGAGTDAAGIRITETLKDVNEIGKSPLIDQYMVSAAQQEALYKVGRHWDEKLGLDKSCSGDALIKPFGLTLLMPIVLKQGSEHPQSGAWQRRFIFERCGSERVYNAIFLASKDGPPLVKPLPPGNTRASLQLMHDALRVAQIVAHTKLSSVTDEKCSEIELIDMAVSAQPEQRTVNGMVVDGVWDEAWTLDCCGKNVTVSGEFVPKPDGGTSFVFK